MTVLVGRMLAELGAVGTRPSLVLVLAVQSVPGTLAPSRRPQRSAARFEINERMAGQGFISVFSQISKQLRFIGLNMEELLDKHSVIRRYLSKTRQSSQLPGQRHPVRVVPRIRLAGSSRAPAGQQGSRRRRLNGCCASQLPHGK